MQTQPELPKLNFKLDWKAYYRRFSEAHGGNPIVYKGRQLFRDGWTYSLNDYAGPEWPPPADPKELLTLQKVYYYTLWNRAQNELMALRSRYDAIKGLQETKSVPLQQSVEVRDNEAPVGKQVSKHTQDWVPDVFELVIAYLEQEVNTSNEHIQQLKEKSDASQERPVDLSSLLVDSKPNGVPGPDSPTTSGVSDQRHADEPQSHARRSRRRPSQKH